MNPSVVVEDNFTTPQSDNTTLANGDWLPATCERKIGTGAQVTDGKLIINSSVLIEYVCPPILPSYNLSKILTIGLLNITSTNTSDIRLSVTLQFNDLFGFFQGITRIQTVNNNHITNFIWTLREFNEVDLSNITRFNLLIVGDIQTPIFMDRFASLSQLCVAKNTEILLANGDTIAIQNIKRGDIIAGDLQLETCHQVARLIENRISPRAPVSIIKIDANAIRGKTPNRDLILTSGHPVLIDNILIPARELRKNTRVKYYKLNKTLACDILPKNSDDSYSLYNIQYDHNGTFIANGLPVSSVPVDSHLMPLPEHLYISKNGLSK